MSSSAERHSTPSNCFTRFNFQHLLTSFNRSPVDFPWTFRGNSIDFPSSSCLPHVFPMSSHPHGVPMSCMARSIPGITDPFCIAMGSPPLPSVLSKMHPLGSRPTRCAVTDLANITRRRHIFIYFNIIQYIYSHVHIQHIHNTYSIS